ncbi:carboxymuconolactone decarboxylase family protein [Streptomyces sp. NBC_01016]|uniref:carboxymuconolactone decarboxylase family protein n=1 Tax=Streptomyces sp. NBC_01016 TaxID=2903720 RepID=UPI0022527D79|nr:carboxymuconolactone decarboxylase family protein [Streptomyces sp. NBC_01016]MCX4831293.1 carboxymuconolactone decarboxylase family protein [Streptomyces sp. NBC_01016]
MTTTPEAGPSGPRITPLPVRQWPPQMHEALAALTPPTPRHPVPEKGADRPKGLNALGVLARYPELTRAFNVFNGHLLFATTLTIRQRELLILRISALRDATYEWKQHTWIARHEADMTDDEIERVSAGPDAAGWSDEERSLLRAVDELIGDARIADATWRRLAEALDERQLMDVVFSVGAYDTIAMAFRTFGVVLDDDLKA